MSGDGDAPRPLLNQPPVPKRVRNEPWQPDDVVFDSTSTADSHSYMNGGRPSGTQLDASRDDFPMCIVWTPIPLLSWVCPAIGHMGIASTDGQLHDFGGSHFIHKSRSRTAFGPVCRYLPVKAYELKFPTESRDRFADWDESIGAADRKYEGMTHNLIFNNCHSHVAMVLNQLRYRGFVHWNTVTLLLWVFLFGHHVGAARTAYTYGPFAVIFLGLLLFMGAGMGLFI